MASLLVGIIAAGTVLRDEYPLVQSRCHCRIVDVYNLVTIVQDYLSNAPVDRDVEYAFPLPPNASVCAFKAVIDETKVIKGVVKEKREARAGYEEAVAKGKTAGLLEQEHADVFRVSLGNLKPQQTVSVHISYISIVPHDGGSPQALRLTIPTAIAPRYGSQPVGLHNTNANRASSLQLDVTIQMNQPVTSINSPSHPIGVTLGSMTNETSDDFNPRMASVSLSDSTFLDRDIVIVITANGLDAPRCTVERWLAGDGAQESTDAYALTFVPRFNLPALPRQEYIFLVDRSGSMGGGRIEKVKASLQVMLRSLPSRNTIFNIVSFGSSFSSLWPTSQAYTAASVEEASVHVDKFSANFGGTELQSALRFTFKHTHDARAKPDEEKMPTSLFLLTDGESWDLAGTKEIVGEHVEDAKKEGSLLRAFVLGVGNQVSTAMCEGIARAGRGMSTFVMEEEKPDAKLMGLLKAARGAVVEDLTVNWPSSASLDEVEGTLRWSMSLLTMPPKQVPFPSVSLIRPLLWLSQSLDRRRSLSSSHRHQSPNKRQNQTSFRFLSIQASAAASSPS